MTTIANIEEFCAHFDRQADVIGRIMIAPLDSNDNAGAGSEHRYKKVLFVTAIDTLSGFRFHRSSYPQLFHRNRERFVRFLMEHGSWPEAELVSLPFLKDELEKSKALTGALGQRVMAKMATFSTEDGGSVLVSEIDEPAAEILCHVTTEKEEELVLRYRHAAILYRYRNSLVHDSREPGNAMEIYDDSHGPYYHGYIGDAKWYLAYPVSMFDKLLRRSIASLRAYFVANSVDPYLLVEDMGRW